MSRTASRAIAGAALLGALILGVTGVVLAAASVGVALDDVLELLDAVAVAVVGALVVWRQRENRFGWVFLLLGVLLSLLPFLDAYAAYVAEVGRDPNVWVAWVAEWSWIPMLFTSLVFWPFLFPDGRLPGSRWRVPLGLAVATCVGASVLAALDPVLDYDDVYTIANPIGVEGLDDIEDGASGTVVALVFVACLLASIASLVVRFRRSSGVARQQIKWITLAAVVMAANFGVIAPVTEAISGRNPSWLYSLGFGVVPAAVAIAILRHGLFDVDVVIRRTVVYAGITVVLGAAYVGLVLVGQAVFSSFAGGGDLAIAVSTLVVAALFLPVRSRVQGFVDRRFYRRRYDAQKTLAAFGVRLRDEVAFDVLVDDLRGVVTETMQPAHVSVCVRQEASQ